MKLSYVEAFATEGGPLLVTDLASAPAWRGTHDDGSGVTVEYMGKATAAFPAALLASKKPGRQEKKFKTLDEARAFEAELLTALKSAFPGAAKHPRYPNQPVYYDGNERVLALELKFNSPYQTVCKALKKQVEDITFDKKKKARGLFLEQEGGGPALVAADLKANVLIVAKPASNEVSPDELVAALEAAKPPTSKTQVASNGIHLVFPAAHAWSELAGPWGASVSPEAIAKWGKTAGTGPIHAPEQKAPCGAFVRLAEGAYKVAAKPQFEVASGTASVVWLVGS